MRLGTCIVLCGAALAGAARADDYYEWEQKLRLLDQRCEEARAARLAPLRQQMARRCERELQRSPDPRAECELQTSTYGNTRTGARGAAIPGLFYDLPECMQADQARRERDAAQPWKH